MNIQILVMLAALLSTVSPIISAKPSLQIGDKQANEIQVLIDVSGSMKQNDPQNLRVAATQLLINLLPDNANVSLWLFAEKTILLSHTDAVNNDWRQEALKASKQIHSHGIYTHIEDAIQTSLEKGFSGNGNKNLIILTDGMVDISKDIMVSADSRERILSEWIPKLQLQKVKVQTIALSDQVDKELLDKLAFETGGWSETAQSADQLQHLFLKTALKIAPKDLLPLENNTFNVDASIKEFSLLIFKQKNASPTQLIRPDQAKISKTSLPELTSWLDTTGYDLITIKQPMPGEWRIEAAIDPDNQLMVLTDLKMHLNELTSFIGDTQHLPLKLHFTEQGNLISRTDFLNLVTINLTVDQQAPIKMEAAKTEPGFFSHTLAQLAQGKHSLAIVADGKTFKREITHDFEVVAAPISVETLVDSADRIITLKFQPDITVLDASTLSITATTHQTGHEPESRLVKEQDGEWLLKLDALPPGETELIYFDVLAKNQNGVTITPALAPVRIDDSLFTPSEPRIVAEHPAQPVAASEPEQSTPNPKDQTAPPSSQTENSWGIIISIVLTINILLCGIGFFVYKLLKKSTEKQQQQLLERLA